VQCQAQAMGGADIPLSDDVRRASTRDAAAFANGTTPRLLFDAMVRRMRARRGNT
jgi:hypothetical protein